MNDTLDMFDTGTGHLAICWVSTGERPVCNRDCLRRLYDVARRLVRDLAITENLLNPKSDQGVCRDASEHIYPECENHNEAQKRDGNPPWCSWCGWRRAVPAEPARKIGKSAAEKAENAKHLPWTPQGGYREDPPIMLGGYGDHVPGEPV